ncbi:MAG: MATE family efflux transporter [Kordiimonas sp.]
MSVGALNTTENPHRKIWAIAGPAILANSSAPLVGLVDTWVIGHLPGAVHLAAVGVGATIFSFLFWAFGFLRMSTTGLIAQAHGRNDIDQVARVTVRSAALGFIIATLLLIVQHHTFVVGIYALSPPESTQTVVQDYFYIRIWSAPAVLFIYAINGYLIGTAQAKRALYLQLVLNICNGALNLVFVLGFGLGVKGIALGSLIAEWLAAFIGVYFLFAAIGWQPIKRAITHMHTWQLSRMKKLLSTNSYIFLRTLVLMVALSLITRQAAALGEATLAASQVMSTFLLLISLGLDSFAYAAEALAGAAYGRRNRKEFRFWVFQTSLWATAVACIYCIGFYFAGDFVINTLTNIESVIVEAQSALWVMALLPIFAVWCYQFDGIFIGATEGRGMLLTMAAAFVVYAALLGYWADEMTLSRLWLSVLIFMTARGLFQAVYYPAIERRLSV